METVGLLLIAFLFAYGAYNHLTSSSDIARHAFDTTRCPFIGAIAGWPTGLYLAATAGLVALGTDVGLWMALGFLVATQALFHRSIGDPGTFKHMALAGALLVILVT